jgi:methionyl-tRNA formyltransferase
MKAIAERYGVPVFQPEDVNTPEGVAGVREFRPNLLVVAAYGQILSREVLELAPKGGINVHASLLPKYRGAAPIAWAIYHGEKRTGVTIIRMSAALDAGDMLAQEAIDILPDETAGELEERLAPLGARLALQVIDQIEAGTARGVKQDKSQVTKAPKLKKEHGLIDWTRTAEQVCNQIRAMQPWPTAYTFRHSSGQPPARLIITKARAAQVSKADSVPPPRPGRLWTVVLPSKRESILCVDCGSADEVVHVLELQPEGKRRMTSTEYLNGRPVQEGDHVGPETP